MASKACRAIAQKALNGINDHNELVLAIDLILKVDSFELMETLKSSLVRSQSSKIKNHLKKLRDEGCSVFDEVIDGLKSKTSLLISLEAPRATTEAPTIRPRPFMSTMSSDIFHEFEHALSYDYWLRLAEGKSIAVHRAILASRWPFFGDHILASSISAAAVGKLVRTELVFGIPGESEDGISYTALLSLVKFFYSGSTRWMTDVDDAVQILATADHFGLASATDPQVASMLVHC